MRQINKGLILVLFATVLAIFPLHSAMAERILIFDSGTYTQPPDDLESTLEGWGYDTESVPISEPLPSVLETTEDSATGYDQVWVFNVPNTDKRSELRALLADYIERGGAVLIQGETSSHGEQSSEMGADLMEDLASPGILSDDFDVVDLASYVSPISRNTFSSDATSCWEPLEGEFNSGRVFPGVDDDNVLLSETASGNPVAVFLRPEDIVDGDGSLLVIGDMGGELWANGFGASIVHESNLVMFVELLSNLPQNHTFCVREVTIEQPVDGELTNEPRPTISGTGEPGETIVIEANGTAVGSVTVDSDSTWSGTPTADLPEGTVVVEATDGESVDSVTIELDTIPPDLTIDSVDSPTNDTQPTITGATEPGSTVTVDTTDGVESLSVDGDGNFSYTPSESLDDGAHSFEFTATDEAGNSSSESVTFEVDTEPPTLTVDSPSEGLTNDNRPEASGTGEPGATIEIDTGDDVETVEVDEDGDWSWEPDEDLDDGEYIWDFTTRDEAGNQTSESVTFEVDTEPPALTVDSPSEGPTNDNRPEASGTGEPGATIEIDTGDDVETVEVDEDGDWSWEPDEDLDDGEYTWDFTARDEAGNEASETVVFEVDTEPPTVAIRGPEDEAVLAEPVDVIEGDSEPEVAIEVVIYSDDGEELETVTTEVDDDGEWSVELDEELDNGEYTAQAQATDAAGNTSEDTVDFVVDTTDQLVINSPGEGDRIRTDKPTLEGTAEPGEEITIEVDGEPVDTVVADDDGNWSWTPDEAYEDGEVTIEVRTDSPSGDRHDEVTFNIDTSTTEVAIDSPEDGDLINDNRPTIEGSAEPEATVTIYVDDQPVGETTADSNGQWSFTPDEAIEDGDRFITAEADDDGIITDDIIDIRIDTVPPTLVVERPQDQEVFREGDEIVVNGRSDVGPTVEIFLDNDSLGEVTVDDDGHFTMILPDDLLEGGYDLRTTATDEAGNVSVDERTFFVEVLPERTVSGGSACSSTSGNGTGMLLLLAGMLLMAVRRRRG